LRDVSVVVVDDNVCCHLATDPDPSSPDFDSVAQRDREHNPRFLSTRYYLSGGRRRHRELWVDPPDCHSSEHKNLDGPPNGHLREASVVLAADQNEYRHAKLAQWTMVGDSKREAWEEDCCCPAAMLVNGHGAFLTLVSCDFDEPPECGYRKVVGVDRWKNHCYSDGWRVLDQVVGCISDL